MASASSKAIRVLTAKGINMASNRFPVTANTNVNHANSALDLKGKAFSKRFDIFLTDHRSRMGFTLRRAILNLI